MSSYIQSLRQLQSWENRSQMSGGLVSLPPAVKSKPVQFVFKNSKNLKSFKKIAPVIGLIGVLLIAGLAILMVSLPSLLINHFVQTFVDRYDTDQTSLEARSDVMLDNLFATTAPDSRYAEINKRRQASENLIKNLESQGFRFNIQNNQIKAVWFKDQPISKADFLTQLQNNVDINQATDLALMSKRTVFQDKVWQKNASNLGLSKAGFSTPKTNNSQEIIDDYRKQEIDLTKVNQSGLRFSTNIPTTDDQQEVNTPSTNIFKSLLDNLNYINQQADNLTKNNQAPYQQNFDNLKFVENDFISNQSSCGAYQNSLFLQDYAKTAQASQQSKFALNLAIEADKIKVGIATPESTEYYGNRLTKTFTTVKKDGTVIETKAATDSIGYKYAAFGDALEPNENAQRYILGSTPETARLIKATDQVSCQGQSKPSWLGGFFANIANAFNSFRLNSSDLSNYFDKNSSRKITENTLAAMSNRHVDPDTSGEDFGNAAAAGFGAFLGRNAARGGNGVLTKQQAVAFLGQQDKYLAIKAKIDQKNLHPLDPSSKYTLVGSLIYNNLPRLSKVASIANFGINLIQTAKISLAAISPISQANSAIKTYNSLSNCHDPMYLNLNKYLENGQEIAFDVFCNPVYGTPTNYLALSTEQVIEKLIASGDLALADPNCSTNCQLVKQAGLADYEKNCVNRGNLPIGNSEGELDDGASCLQNSEHKALYAIYFIDSRLQAMFDQMKLVE